MKPRRTALLALLAFLLIALALVAMPARAGDAATFGDAMSLFQAWNNGANVVRSVGAGNSGQFEDPLNIAILPFLPFLDGWHYCVEDHHLIMVALITVGDASFKRQDAAAELDPITQTFMLDGQQLDTQRTPIKRRLVNTFGFDRAFAINEGAVVTPAEMGVGPHTIDWSIVYADGTTESETITVYMDAAGTGACE